jgi:hypothetical protein
MAAEPRAQEKRASAYIALQLRLSSRSTFGPVIWIVAAKRFGGQPQPTCRWDEFDQPQGHYRLGEKNFSRDTSEAAG